MAVDSVMKVGIYNSMKSAKLFTLLSVVILSSCSAYHNKTMHSMPTSEMDEYISDMSIDELCEHIEYEDAGSRYPALIDREFELRGISFQYCLDREKKPMTTIKRFLPF